MLLDIIIAASSGGAGMTCGWVMHALYNQGLASDGPQPSPQTPATSKASSAAEKALSTDADTSIPAATEDVPDSEKVMAVADRVRQFTHSIAADVDAHQSRVENLSMTLHESDLSNSPPAIVDAVEQMLGANEIMRNQLADAQARIREQSQQLQSAEQRAQTDALTQIYNRGAFDEHLLRRHALGPSRAGVLAVLDVDHFKKFNDTHGHRAGDEVLRVVSQLLDARLQPHGMVARFGGEEFVMLLHDKSLAEAVDLIEQTRIAIGTREVRFEGKCLKVNASVGIGALEPQQSAEEWLQRTDEALYRSKEMGRNCAHYIDQERFIRAGEVPTETIAKDSSTAANVAGQPISSSSDLLQAPAVSPRAQEEDLATEVEALARETRSTVQAEPTPAPRAAKETLINQAPSNPLEDVSLVDDQPFGERPKALSYLPDLATMVDYVEEMQTSPHRSKAPNQLMSVRLSGTPSGATMRSLLQLVRAATRNQDHIGCLDQSTLVICMPQLDAEDAMDRAQQICGAAGSIGMSLAAAEKSTNGEKLSIGILQIASSVNSMSAYEKSLKQACAIAGLAARQSGQDDQLPVLSHQMASA
ncbi:diguanylate cyclase/phosphodiesterase (GGDEF & EAL domain) with PAS/PAC sensor(s) [Rhodopirellula islandica]|uniref:diguanylate cyclase n=1 Tax=Rhodopirellula islandica TaxID=595434 RepID=A0A0J1BH88_RHOIS|nr:GGDEF domain-containing protein [Rhodopirellula islandica]KLU05892.1 diguanylate cyclase/phosphodiesterase (GGDEF & EAL domain) with PAS/PAC sensor(s) [Rhodopirellula islandica]